MECHKDRARRRPEMECLEVRWCPAVSASVVRGSLQVLGDSTGAALRLTQVDAQTFKVEDGATTVGQFAGVTRDVNVALGDGKDTVTVDLNGQTTPRGLSIATAAGDDTISVFNGRVGRTLNIALGSGADSATLGGAAGALTVGGSTFVAGDGTGDALSVGAGADLQGTLAAGGVNAVTLDASSVLRRGASLVGGFNAANTFVLNGRVDRDVYVSGGSAVDTLTVAGTATLARNLTAYLGSGNDTVSIGPRVGGGLLIDAGDGDDAVTINSADGRTTLLLGAGNDTLTVNGAIGTPDTGRGRFFGGFFGRLFGRVSPSLSRIDAGSGDDAVTFTAPAPLNGPVGVAMGSGNDTLSVADASTPLDLRADGGAGTDTYRGRKERLRFTPSNFETFA